MSDDPFIFVHVQPVLDDRVRPLCGVVFPESVDNSYVKYRVVFTCKAMVMKGQWFLGESSCYSWQQLPKASSDTNRTDGQHKNRKLTRCLMMNAASCPPMLNRNSDLSKAKFAK